MSRFVIDASVAIKWVIRETLSDSALLLLEAEHELLAPDLFIAESANILWKKVRRNEMSRAMAVDRFKGLMAMGMRITSSADVAHLALEIAIEADRTVYDSVYVATAVQHGCRMATADERLVNGLKATKYSGSVMWIGDI